MSTRADLTNEDALELVLLAAVGHPEPGLRSRLAARLNAHVEAGQPLYSVSQVRAFLEGQPGREGEPFVLAGPALELAVLLLRMVFSQRMSNPAGNWVRIVSPASSDSAGGLLVSSSVLFGLQGEYPGPAIDRARLNRQLRPYWLSAPALEARLHCPPEGNALTVSCESEEGFRLTVRGSPWGRLDTRAIRNFQEHSALGSGAGLATLGLTVEVGEKKALCVRTTTPESVRRFMACLAREERLVLRRRVSTEESALVVGLRPFTGSSAELPALVVQPVREEWVNLPPLPALRLDLADRLAIARWLYPPAPWMDRLLLDGLLPRGPGQGAGGRG